MNLVFYLAIELNPRVSGHKRSRGLVARAFSPYHGHARHRRGIPGHARYIRFAGYSPQILDAHAATIRRIAGQIDLDFVLHTGDATENAQENELAWFLTAMDSGALNPNSGAAIEPGSRFAGPEHQPFYAQGLGPTPWYFTLGNHDELVMGSLTPTEALNELAMGGFAPLGYSTPLPLGAPFIGISLPFELQGASITPDPKKAYACP